MLYYRDRSRNLYSIDEYKTNKRTDLKKRFNLDYVNRVESNLSFNDPSITCSSSHHVDSLHWIFAIGFQVQNMQKDLYLVANNDADMNLWVNEICKLCKLHRQNEDIIMQGELSLKMFSKTDSDSRKRYLSSGRVLDQRNVHVIAIPRHVHHRATTICRERKCLHRFVKMKVRSCEHVNDKLTARSIYVHSQSCCCEEVNAYNLGTNHGFDGDGESSEKYGVQPEYYVSIFDAILRLFNLKRQTRKSLFQKG